MLDAERQKFFKAAFPVLGEMLRKRGAVAILDARAIFVSAEAIDVTDDLIAELDAALKSGADQTGADQTGDNARNAPAPGNTTGAGN